MPFRAIVRLQFFLCWALACAIPSNASVIVQLKVMDGEGAVYKTGARATRGLTVLVTDETGKPVENASVSFRLPEDGATGVFNSGLRTEVVTTGPDGRAAVWGMQWNKTPGPVEIRITAVKDQARAGILSTQYLSEALVTTPRAGGEGVFTAPHKSSTKWIILGAIAAGAAVAGMAFGRSSSSTPTTAPVGITIGNPSIIIGHP